MVVAVVAVQNKFWARSREAQKAEAAAPVEKIRQKRERNNGDDETKKNPVLLHPKISRLTIKILICCVTTLQNQAVLCRVVLLAPVRSFSVN